MNYLTSKSIKRASSVIFRILDVTSTATSSTAINGKVNKNMSLTADIVLSRFYKKYQCTDCKEYTKTDKIMDK